MNTIKMYGPSISDPSKIVNRDVPENDEQAYASAGYKRGSIDEPEPVTEFADLSKMTKAELLEEADRQGLLEVNQSMTKADIVAIIEAAK